MRRQLRAVESAALGLLLLLSAACGSRLPESDFEHRDAPVTSPAGTVPLRVGIITSANSPVGAAAFTGPRDGAKAWFERLNARGGIAGRPVEVRQCDDGGSGVGDNELWRLIRDASFTAFISLHEGFGLPVAESLACGTPVLTTAYGSQGEIAAGGGCLTVDPRDAEAVAVAVRRMRTDRDLVVRLRAEAVERPVETWGAYAENVWDALVAGFAS